MRIVRVVIDNFRTIKKLTFYPSQHNILIGRVNAGKSTLLNALAIVLDPDISRRFQIVDELDFHARGFLGTDGSPIPLRIEVTIAGCSDVEKASFLDFWEPWNDATKQVLEDSDDIKILDDDRYEFAFRMAFRATYDSAEDGFSCIWYYPKFSFLGGSDDYRACPRADRDQVGFFAIPAEREVRKALSFSRYSALDKALRADDVSLETQLMALVNAVKGQGEVLFQNTGFAALVEEIEEQVDTLLRLSPDAKRRILFELSDLGHYDVMRVLRAFIALDGQDQPYPVTSQGMGAKQILVLAALRMLSKRRQSSILAVEEPETGLHPHMQRVLVDDLLHSSSQTFITTHSVHVAETVGLEQIFSLLDTGNGNRRIVKAAPSVEDGCAAETVRAVAQLTGHHPSDMLDALYAPSVLLTEGVSDRQAVPTLLRRLSREAGSMGKNLDGLGIAIIPCLSKNRVPDVAPYFKAQLGKDVYALVDNEPSTDAATSQTVDACDCTFIWPPRCAIERVLLLGAEDATINSFIQRVTDELGDGYFRDASSSTKAADDKRTDVFNYFKRSKASLRLFAQWLPVDEIAAPVRQLFAGLNSLTQGQDLGKRVQLAAQAH